MILVKRTRNRTASMGGGDNATGAAGAGGSGEPGVAADGAGSPYDSAGERFVHVGEIYIIPTILLVAIITNSLSLSVLPVARIVRTFRQCLVALTISDLFATTIGFTNVVMENVVYGGDIPHGYWDKRTVAMYVMYYAQLMFMCTSATIVIFIVATRHWIVKNPLKARQITSRKTKSILFGLFLLNFIIFIPTSLNIMYQSCFNDYETPECVDIHQRLPNLEAIFKGYLYTLSTVYGPVLIIVYIACLIGIRATLRSSEKVLQKLTAESLDLMDNPDHPPDLRRYPSGASTRSCTQASRVQSTTKITKTLVMIVILDTICTLPTVIQAIANLVSPKATVFSTTSEGFRVFDVISEIFLAMRPAYNFWLYVFSHDEFRAAFENRFGCKCMQLFCSILPCYREAREKDRQSRKISHLSNSGSGSTSQDKSMLSNTTHVSNV